MHGMWTVALLAAGAAAANVTAISARDELSFTTRWCAEDGGCQLHGDTAATCSTAGRCSCSSDHESRLVGSVDVQLCFPKTVVVEVLIDFNVAASASCIDVGVSAYVRRGVAGMIEEYTGGRVAYWDFGCHPTQNRPYVAAAVAVPSQCYSTGRDVCSTSTAYGKPTAEECQAECAGQDYCWSWSYHPRHRTADGAASVAVCNLCDRNVTEASPVAASASAATVSDYVVSGPKVCAQRQRRWSCDRFVCAVGFTDKGDKENIECRATGCTAETCCDQILCGSYTCDPQSHGNMKDPTIACPTTGCTAQLCCEGVCRALCWDWSPGFPSKPYYGYTNNPQVPAGTRCGPAGCLETCCIQSWCSSVNCVGRLPNSDRCGAAGEPPCDAATCCTVDVCSSHTCGATAGSLTFDSATKRCNPAGCDDATCCAKDACVSNPNAAQYVTCQRHYREHTDIATRVCDRSLSPITRCDNYACCERIVYCSSFECSAGFVSKAGAAVLECRACNDATCCDKKVDTLQERLNKALHADLRLRTLLGTSAIVAFDTQREAQRTRCHTETPTHSLPDNAAVLFANPAGVCRPGRCDVGFHASPPAACVAVSPSNTGAFGTCVVDGDCTWEAGRPVCHRAQGRCAPRQAVLPEKVRLPSPLERDYCLRDADCQDSGDSKATCDVHPGLGNWCRCSEGFGYPARFVPRCAREGQTPQPVDMGFTVAFDLPCPLQTRQVRDIVLLVHNVMGGASKEAAGARDVSDVHHVCLATGGYVLLGRVRVPINTANNLGASTDAAALLKRFKEELDVEWLNGVTAADGGKFRSLTTYPTSVAAGVVSNCVRDGATYARLDPEGKCHALACAQYYSLQPSSTLLTCKLGEVTTPAPHAVDASDDTVHLTHAQIVGIVMGTASGVGVLSLLCFAVVRYRHAAQEEPDDVEMSEAAGDEA